MEKPDKSARQWGFFLHGLRYRIWEQMLQCCCHVNSMQTYSVFFAACCNPPIPSYPQICGLHGCFENAPGKGVHFFEGEPKQPQNHRAAPVEGSCVALPGERPGVSARGNAAVLKMPSFIFQEKKVWHLGTLGRFGIIFKEAAPILSPSLLASHRRGRPMRSLTWHWPMGA